MPRTTEQKIFIVEAYFRQKSIHAAQLQFKERFGCREFPVDSMIYRWVNKFRTHGTVHHLTRKDTNRQSHSGRPKSSSTPHNVAAVRDSVVHSPSKSVRRRSQELGINRNQVGIKFWTALGRRSGVVRVLQWFQQDGAIPHASNESLAWLQQSFPDRLISRRCDPQWSPHSPDLNPPYFYMCGYLKDRVYGNNPQTIPDLKAAITVAIRAIPREECGRVIKNFAAGSKCACSAGALIWSTFLSASETKSFCSKDVKLGDVCYTGLT